MKQLLPQTSCQTISCIKYTIVCGIRNTKLEKGSSHKIDICRELETRLEIGCSPMGDLYAVMG